VLARASLAEVSAMLDRHGGVPPHEVLKAAEVGTVMVEARAGGTGVRFNLGEATVARCVVRIADGPTGVAYVLGSDRRKAHVAALLDALLQSSAHGRSLADEVGVLAQRQDEARQLASRKAAATKVEFFTLQRGSE
jgi:alpha-D-ribose 1-methylphosphonate 5-triphosphate synthase subunit PhnG